MGEALWGTVSKLSQLPFLLSAVLSGLLVIRVLPLNRGLVYCAVSSAWSRCYCGLWLAERLTISKHFTAALHATNGSSCASAGNAALPMGSWLLHGWL